MRAILFAAAILTTVNVWAQAPQLVVEAANSPATTAKIASTQSAKGSDALPEVIKSLEASKAMNVELMKRQEATMQALDELQREADQIRIYSKRG